MAVSFVEIVYNIISTLSNVNFIYLFISDTLYYILQFRYTYPLLFTLLSRNYIYQNITQNKKEIVCYTACIHAVILALFSILYLVNVINIGYYNWVLDYSVVYNVIDVYYLIKNNSSIKNQMICHHFFVITAILYRQFYDTPQLYNYYIAMNFLSEITAVPLNISWLFYIRQKTNTTTYKVASLTTLCLYLPFRVLLNTYLFYDQVYTIDTPIIYLQGMLMLLNYFWFYKLCRICFGYKFG
jgi:hypothetical protein